jgi:hypothetical protein
MADHLVQGQRVSTPVQIRDATACSAMFAVSAAAARSVVGASGLTLAEPIRGRAICSLAFVRYVDGDLGPYHEFAVSFLVRRPAGAVDASKVGAFIHWLPVNQPFTLDAGRSIWGFPKEMADIELRSSGGHRQCIVHQDGQLVIDLRVKPGIPVPGGSASTSFDAYSHQDGVTRRTPWTMRPEGVRSRPGGARVRLGRHPVATMLGELGLPKAALFTSAIRQLRMTFGDAETVAR